jgi:hypothetical protein
MTTEYTQRRDSDGVVHYVDRQNEPMSCALSSIMMIEDQIERQCHEGEMRIKRISAAFPGSLFWSQLFGENSGLGNGTGENNISPTLRSIGVSVTQADSFDCTAAGHSFSWRKQKIRDGKPALVLVGWYRRVNGAETRNGGHFIVAARKTTNRQWIVILDPATGTLHELHGLNGFYFNHGQRGRIDAVWYTG